MIKNDLDALAKYEQACFENEKSFLLRFATWNSWQLASIAFSSEVIRFVYVLHCGQHISNSCKILEFIKWYEENVNVQR